MVLVYTAVALGVSLGWLLLVAVAVTERWQSFLAAALGFAQLSSRAQELLHRWLDTWSGLGAIAVGMHRAGWDLQLTEYGDGHWRATFYVTDQAHMGGSA